MTRRIHLVPQLGSSAAAVGLVALLGACSSVSPTRFHTLMPASVSATPAIAPAGAVAWEVLPVAIPAQVDQPQWVVRTADGSLTVLEQERWIAPLGEEIRAAVAEHVTQVLGSPATPVEPGKVWRVRIDVQRFDSAPGRETRFEATWSLSSSDAETLALRCHGEFVQRVAAGGYPALALGQQQNVAELADKVTRALESLSAGRAATCAG
jgi:uncharacterized lipoprotein YmbA